MDESTAYLLCFVVGPFLLSLLLEYGVGRIPRPALRRVLSLPLPILSGGALLLAIYKINTITGWDRLAWEILGYLSGFALAGTALGWLLARGKRKQ